MAQQQQPQPYTAQQQQPYTAQQQSFMTQQQSYMAQQQQPYTAQQQPQHYTVQQQQPYLAQQMLPYTTPQTQSYSTQPQYYATQLQPLYSMYNNNSWLTPTTNSTLTTPTTAQTFFGAPTTAIAIYHPPTINDSDRFDGYNMDVHEFTSRFKTQSLINEWNTNRQLVLLQAYVKGDALTKTKLLVNSGLSIDEIINTLNTTFNKPQTVYINAYNELQPQHQQNVIEFATKLSSAHRKAWPDATEAQRESQLKDRFITTLPSRLKDFIRYGSLKQSWTELIQSTEQLMSKFELDIEPTSINGLYANNNWARPHQKPHSPFTKRNNTPRRTSAATHKENKWHKNSNDNYNYNNNKNNANNNGNNNSNNDNFNYNHNNNSNYNRQNSNYNNDNHSDNNTNNNTENQNKILVIDWYFCIIFRLGVIVY
jgi:hypothetical protein